MTNTEKFELIASTMADNEEIVEFCKAQIASIEKAAAKAKERRAAKAAEEDIIIGKVEAALSATPQTAQDIADAIGEEDITKAKCVNRLTKLIEAGKAAKEQVKNPDGKGKVTVYVAC